MKLSDCKLKVYYFRDDNFCQHKIEMKDQRKNMKDQREQHNAHTLFSFNTRTISL